MKIMVCLKQVPNQDAQINVASDGKWIQEDGLKFELNPYDIYALEEALKLKDSDEAEVLVVCAGPARATQGLRTALGMGADRAIHINDAEAESSDTLGMAKILAAVAKEESPDLIFMGLMSDDGNFAAIGPMLAELTGIVHTTAAMKLSRADGKLTVERELEGGNLEVVELTTPCLVTTQTGINQVRYASLKGIMAAKKKPLDVKSVADLGLDGQVGAAQAKMQIDKIYVPTKGDGAEIIEGSAAEVAGTLVSKIKELGLL